MIVSGIATSRTSGSAGAARAPSPPSSSCRVARRPCGCAPAGGRGAAGDVAAQLERAAARRFFLEYRGPAPSSSACRVFVARLGRRPMQRAFGRRLASRGGVAGLAAASARGFGRLGGFGRLRLRPRPSPRLPRLRFSFLVLRLAACSCFFCSSSCWRAISSWRLASPRPRAPRAPRRCSDAGAAGGFGASSTGAARLRSRRASRSTRFLRTSTWIVRALPVESGGLDLGGLLARQRDLLLRLAAAPCCLRR